MNGSYLGPQFSDLEIKKSLNILEANYDFFKDDDLIEKISNDLFFFFFFFLMYSNQFIIEGFYEQKHQK
jgi:hypothetical protein